MSGSLKPNYTEICKDIIGGQKKIYSIGTLAQCYKKFHGRNTQIFVHFRNKLERLSLSMLYALA
jgi:hypothetical protein